MYAHDSICYFNASLPIYVHSYEGLGHGYFWKEGQFSAYYYGNEKKPGLKHEKGYFLRVYSYGILKQTLKLQGQASKTSFISWQPQL